MKNDIENLTESNNKKTLHRIIGIGLALVIAVGTITAIKLRTSSIETYTVSGNSMSPTLQNGDVININTSNKDVKRFDVALFNFNDTKYVKRVIGLPNETVSYSNNILYINGEEVDDPYNNGKTEDFSITLGENDIYVLGDNRAYSKDSRKLGRFRLGYIIGVKE